MKLSSVGLATYSVIIKNLISVVEYGIDDTTLPPSILDIWSSIGAHQGWPEYDGKVARTHPICPGALLHSV